MCRRHETLQQKPGRQGVIEKQYATHGTEEWILLAEMRHDGKMERRECVMQTHPLETKTLVADDWLFASTT